MHTLTRGSRKLLELVKLGFVTEEGEGGGVPANSVSGGGIDLGTPIVRKRKYAILKRSKGAIINNMTITTQPKKKKE